MKICAGSENPATLAVARQKDIIVNAVQAGGARDTERVWREIAQQGRAPAAALPTAQMPAAWVLVALPGGLGAIALGLALWQLSRSQGPAVFDAALWREQWAQDQALWQEASRS